MDVEHPWRSRRRGLERAQDARLAQHVVRRRSQRRPWRSAEHAVEPVTTDAERDVRVARADRLDRERAASEACLVECALDGQPHDERRASQARRLGGGVDDVEVGTCRGTPARGPPRDRHAVGLGGTVVDPERAELRGEARERQLVGHAEPAAQLHRAVDHAADGLRDEHLGDTRLVTRGLARVEHLRAAADQRPARVEVDHAVGDQGLGDALLVEAPTEELALGCVVEGHVERSACEAEPPHAVGQPRRSQPRLRQPESQPDLAEHGIVRDAAVVEHELCVPACERAVDGADEPLDAHPRVLSRHDEHRRAAIADEAGVGPGHADRERGTAGTCHEALAAADAPASRNPRGLRAKQRGVRACAGRRLAHGERRAHRARGERAQEALLLLVAADLGEQVHVPLVRCGAVQGEWPEQAVPGLLEYRRLRAHVESQTPVRTRHRRGQQTGRARGCLQLLADVVRRPVSGVGRTPLGGHHDVAHEGADAVAKLERLGCEPRVGGQPATTVPV